MFSMPGRLAFLFIVLSWLASACVAQPPRVQVVFQPNYATAQQLAKKSGLPVLALVVAKGDKLPPALTDAKVVKRSNAFLNAKLPAEGAVAKKLGGVNAGAVVFLDGEGELVGQVEPGYSTEQLLEKMTDVMDKARAQVLERLKNEKENVAGQKVALNSYVRLGASVSDLIPLLTYTKSEVKAAVRSLLAARYPEGVDWLLLNAMASPDPDVRAACFPVTLDMTRTAKVRPLKFWRDAAEEDRAAELKKWREAAYGKVLPVNKAILDFALLNYGKQVNNGECSRLAEEALKAAKAQPMKHDGKTYIWGRALAATEKGLVGDIVQMENAKFSDGVSAPHHTQVIRRVLGPRQYEVLEQNASGRRTVGLGKLNLALLKQGTVVIYRPLPMESADK